MAQEMAQFRPSAPPLDDEPGAPVNQSSNRSKYGRRPHSSGGGHRRRGSNPKSSGRYRVSSRRKGAQTSSGDGGERGGGSSDDRESRHRSKHRGPRFASSDDGRHRAPSDGGDRHKHGHVVHKIIPDQIVKSESQYANIHMDLQRLMDEERMLLRTDKLTAAEKAKMKEGFFFQQMELMMKLPPDEQERYHPKKRLISRMGTTRHNLYNEEEEEHRPIFCGIVIALNLMAFFLEMREADWHFEKTSENPMIGPSLDVLLSSGAKDTRQIKDEGEWWRLFVPIFLHAGILHLIIDTLVFVRLGMSIERAFGFWRVGSIYVASGVCGTMASAIFLPEVVTVGASGALFGLIGSLFGDFIQNYKTIVEGRRAYFFQLVITTIVGLCIGLFPGIDNFTHVGGWVMGVLLANCLLAGVIKDSHGMPVTTWYTTPLAVISLVAAVFLFIVGYSLLYSRDPVNCSWCEKINCIDSTWWECEN